MTWHASQALCTGHVTNFGDPSVVIMVIAVTIVGLLMLMPLCHVLANSGLKQSPK